MFGIRFIKFDSTMYVIHYKNGKIKHEGRGLSFYYYAPKSSITAVPVGSNDIPFIFNETTTDFQGITIQGQITYKINNPKQLAELLDFTVDYNAQYKTEDAEKLDQRLINEAQTATSSFIQSLSLKEALRSAKKIENEIANGLKQSKAVEMLGVEPLSINVVAIKTTPEMTRALETSTREGLQKEADLAVYERRNFAVEQERIIKESELSTQIAVEEKKKQISEKKMEARIMQQENDRKLREMKMEADIALEEQKQSLIDMKVENQKKEADSNKYVVSASLEPYKEMDWKILSALSGSGSNPKSNMALAFRELAENAQKIGSLNITPDLLNNILNSDTNQPYTPPEMEQQQNWR